MHKPPTIEVTTEKNDQMAEQKTETKISPPTLPLTENLEKRGGPFNTWRSRFFVCDVSAISLEQLKKCHDKNVISSLKKNKAKFEEKNKDLFETMATATVTGKGLIFYYDSEQQNELLGIIDLRKVKATSKADYCLEFFTDGKSTVIKFPSKESLETWTAAIDASELTDVSDTAEYKDVYNKLVNGSAFPDEATSKVKKALSDLKAKISKNSESLEETEEEIEEVKEEPAKETEDAEEEVKDEGEAVVESPKAVEETVKEEETKEEAPEVHESTVTEPEEAVGQKEEPAEPKEEDNFKVEGEILCKGWLFKQSAFWRVWNRRYLILHVDDNDVLQLTHFRPNELDGHLTLVVGKNAVCKPTKDTQGRYEFYISSGGNRVNLACESLEDRQTWLDTLESIFKDDTEESA